MKKIAILLSLLNLQFINCSEITEPTKFQKVTSTSKHIVSDIALAYGTAMAITTTHEVGHAVAAKLLFNAPINISIGAVPWYNAPAIVQFGGIALRGFNPAIGYSSQLAVATPLQHIIVCLSGPLLGALSSYLMVKYLKEKFPSWKQFPLTKLISYFAIYNNLSNLYPARMNDGAQAYQAYLELSNSDK